MRHLLLLALTALSATHADVVYTVRSDGSGQYTSVQAALDAATRAQPVLLDLRGRFRERVHVYSNFTQGLTFLGTGESPLDALVIYNVSGNSGAGTFNSWTWMIDALNVTLVNVAVANNANGYNRKLAGQSVALHLNGGSAQAQQYVRLLNSSFLGAQDTVYLGSQNSLSYAHGCYFNGSVDAIFSESSSVIESSIIEMTDTASAARGQPLVPGALTAWQTGPGDVTAYLWLNCNISVGWWEPSEGLVLGRPWGAQAQTVLKDCYLGPGMQKVGWNDWGHNCTKGHSTWCDQVVYAEYNSTGPSADPGGKARAWWSHQLTPAQAANWNTSAVLRGWDPMEGLRAGQPLRALIDSLKQ